MTVLLGMQSAPGRHGDGAVLVVLGHMGRGRCGPGGRVGEGELGAVAARPAGGAGWAWWRVGVEATIRAQPYQHRCWSGGQVEGELGGVVAGVEDEQGHRLGGAEPSKQRADLRGGGLVGVVQGMQPPGVDRGGPGVPGEAELADPLERPAGDDRLAGRVAGGVVVQAALGGAFGVAARPGGDVHRIDRQATRQGMADQQVAQPLGVDVAAGQRGVGAAPAAPVGWFQAQLWQRRDRPLGAQQRIGQVNQRIPTAGAAGVQLGPERSQPRQRHRRVGVGGSPDGSTLPAAATVVSFVTYISSVRRITRWPRTVTGQLTDQPCDQPQG